MPVYATSVEYAAWLGTAAPAGATRALRAASGRVDEMLIASVYPVNASGAPTEAAHIEALRDATCAQADYARAIGDQYSTGGQQWASVKIGTAALTRGTGSGGGTTAASKYSSEAFGILQRAGLVNQEAWVW